MLSVCLALLPFPALNNVFKLIGLHEMFKVKSRGAEGRRGFLEVVLTSPTRVDDRKKKTRRLPDLPAADIRGVGCMRWASLSSLPGQQAVPLTAVQSSLSPPNHPLRSQHLPGNGAGAACLGDGFRQWEGDLHLTLRLCCVAFTMCRPGLDH